MYALATTRIYYYADDFSILMLVVIYIFAQLLGHCLSIEYNAFVLLLTAFLDFIILAVL